MTAPSTEQFHISAKYDYPQAELLPLPSNIDQSETIHFSPLRYRDISSNAICSHNTTSTEYNAIDVTVDASGSTDQHLSSYDCRGMVNLNSSMQSNVPTPLGGMHKFSHLNMPGGQWGQGIRFVASDMNASHYTNLRRSVRQNWSGYDEQVQNNTTNKNKGIFMNGMHSTLTNACLNVWHVNKTNTRFYSSTSQSQSPKNDGTEKIVQSDKVTTELSRKDKLKKAVKEYGSTVIIFHVGISLVSLGSFYLLVSR